MQLFRSMRQRKRGFSVFLLLALSSKRLCTSAQRFDRLSCFKRITIFNRTAKVAYSSNLRYRTKECAGGRLIWETYRTAIHTIFVKACNRGYKLRDRCQARYWDDIVQRYHFSQSFLPLMQIYSASRCGLS